MTLVRQCQDGVAATDSLASVVDSKHATDLLASPFYFRTLFGHARVDRRMTREVVDYVLRIVARSE